MRAILIDPIKHKASEIDVVSPAAALGTQSLREFRITLAAWKARFGRSERAVSAINPGDGAFIIDLPSCAGHTFRGKTIIVGGDVGEPVADSMIELSVLKTAIKYR